MARRLLPLVLLSALAACSCGGGGAAAADAPGGPGTATLAWMPSPSPAVAGYRIYYGTAPRSYLQARGEGIAVGAVESHVVTGLRSGVQYHFAVTAVDHEGRESDYSNEASKTVE